ncbi:MAG: NADH-ubiquinone oxidoreductase-F iron-sulfur binding region domain-containing protein, partial [Ktedonobacterales bacterium]
DDPALVTFDAYRKQGGYVALQQALAQLSPTQVVDEVRAAGLRGRGGAGVLTAEKLALAQRAAEDPKYLICNAYDADPRSLISRTLLARNPHLVIEGMALAGYAIGATEGYLYMRGEQKDTADIVRAALREALDKGMLGRKIFGSSFAFTITLVGVDIGFMGGEESTLIQVIKGRPAKAQQRPPYPTDFGLFNRPTVVQNIETLINLPRIVARGGGAYKQMGTLTSPGTKLFTIIGDGAETGKLVEVPLGATLQEALRQAGVTVNESTARAVVVGGMEGGALPLSQLSTVLDFETLEDAGAIMGSSVIEVAPRATCMVRWAMERSEYLSRETCGKCGPCRVGVKRIAGTLQGIVSGLGTTGDMELLTEFCQYVPDGSLCG